MKLHADLPYWPALLGLVLLSLHTKLAHSLTITYCSNQNTATGDGDYIRWNSNGACQTHCQATSAFGVVQGQYCWCTDYIPADTTSNGDCSDGCPGYPYETCGNVDEGLFGYVALSIQPSGTLGASTASPSAIQVSSSIFISSSPDPPPASPPPSVRSSAATPSIVSTVTLVVTSQAPQRTVTLSASSSPPPLTSSSQPSTSDPESSEPLPSTSYVPTTKVSVSTEVSSATVTPSPVTSVRVVYVSGAPVTETVTSTPVAEPNSSAATVEVQRKTGLSAGAVAGAVLGVLFGVAAIALAAFLLWRRRRRQNDAQPQATGAAGAGAAGGAAQGGNNPRRNISVLSKTGLLARARDRPSMSERDHDEHQYYIPAMASNRHSMLLGLSGDGVESSSPLGGSQDGEPRRSSKPFIYDQRLNPSALYANQDNGSRVSMQDNNDYSRPLGVANPDTRPSFESRISN